MSKKASQRKPVPVTGEFLLYTSPDGQVRIEIRMQGETVWLNQKQLAELFQTSIPNINMHIKNIFDERELTPEATIQDFLTVQKEGNREVQRNLTCYNLDLIISVGYRIKSHVATHFRQWATQRLREYIIKGFTMDDERLKQAGNVKGQVSTIDNIPNSAITCDIAGTLFSFYLKKDVPQ